MRSSSARPKASKFNFAFLACVLVAAILVFAGYQGMGFHAVNRQTEDENQMSAAAYFPHLGC